MPPVSNCAVFLPLLNSLSGNNNTLVAPAGYLQGKVVPESDGEYLGIKVILLSSQGYSSGKL